MLTDPVKLVAVETRSLEELTAIARAHITRLKVARGEYVLLDAEKNIREPALVIYPRTYPPSYTE